MRPWSHSCLKTHQMLSTSATGPRFKRPSIINIKEFLVLLLTLIVVYHDNCRPVFERRFANGLQYGAARHRGLEV